MVALNAAIQQANKDIAAPANLLPDAQITVLATVDGVGVACCFKLESAEHDVSYRYSGYEQITSEWKPVPITNTDKMEYYVINNRMENHGTD